MLVNSNDNTNLKQAGVLSGRQSGTMTTHNVEMMNTLLEFATGVSYEPSYVASRNNNNVFQGGTRKNIKQAATVDDIEILQTLLEFQGQKL